MALPFLLHGAQLAREEAIRTLEVSVQRLGNLVLNLTALAERLEARPSHDLDEARERQHRVKVLREAAVAGQQAIGKDTAHLGLGSVQSTSSESTSSESTG